jgi:NAD+ kinase
VKLRKVVIAYKADNSVSHTWAERCSRELEALGCHVLMGPSGVYDNPYPVFLESMRDIDLALILGGDGSTLGAARYLAAQSVPILAINTGGHLGFLTQAAEDFEDTQQVWERLLNDRYAIETRMMLQAQVVDAQVVDIGGNEAQSRHYFFGLNEMCVKPASPDRMITATLELEIDGEIVDQYHGDGLIIATPTGSTSYVVAANGPILHPGMEAIVITPICAMSLSSRTIVLPPKLMVSIWSLADDPSIKLWTDGVLARSILPGQRVDISMATHRARFVILRENYSFYQALREKLLWSGTRRQYQNKGVGFK